MLFSALDVVSPKLFLGKTHFALRLNAAKTAIKSRLAGQSQSSETETCTFLWSWLVYLQLFGTGALSFYDQEFSASWILRNELDEHPDALDEIDPAIGCTRRATYILTAIAILAQKWQVQKLTVLAPDLDIQFEKERLRNRLLSSVRAKPRPPTSIQPTEQDSANMATVNEAFHWAGLVNLLARVPGDDFGFSLSPITVLEPVTKIFSCLDKIEEGSTSERSMLFPVFSAGCYAQQPSQKTRILQALRRLEEAGVMQVRPLHCLTNANIGLTSTQGPQSSVPTGECLEDRVALGTAVSHSICAHAYQQFWDIFTTNIRWPRFGSQFWDNL